MTYTQSKGLRDREYNKFTAGQSAGSNTIVNTQNTIKQYKFDYADCVGNTISEYTDYPLNGMLKGVVIYNNNFTATGSMFLRASGIESTAWSMVSGTTRGIGIGASGLTLPLASTVRTNSTIISGTSTANEYTEIPMDSVMHLVGTAVGVNKSGAIAIVYR